MGYSQAGLPGTDQLPSDAFQDVPVPLNGSGRFLVEVKVENGSITCDLTNDQAGLPTIRIIDYAIPGFEPFEGYLGFTASTGVASENHILHSVRIEPLSGETCKKPPAVVTRDIESPEGDDPLGRPLFRDGSILTVRLTLTEIRDEWDPVCLPVDRLLVDEVLPPGWMALDVSDGGAFDPSSGIVGWDLPGLSLMDGKILEYRVAAVAISTDTQRFQGSFQDDAGAKYRVSGEGIVSSAEAASLDLCGSIRIWNILGAYDNPGGAESSEDTMRLDYMTDGLDWETSFIWAPGATVATAFGGPSASTSIQGGGAGRNPTGIPEVFPWQSPSGRVNLQDAFGGDLNDVMAYAQVYVVNTTGSDMPVYLGISSDDSVQVLLNGEEVWIHSIPRPASDACMPHDVTPDGIRFIDPPVLLTGENSLVVKVFEGGGQWEFAVRFQDEFGTPITDGLEIRLKGEEGGPIEKPKFRRGDANSDGKVDLTDAIVCLGYLFLGENQMECMDAADTDDSGILDLSDPIRILNYLFLSGPQPAPPGPATCGSDPGLDVHLGCDRPCG